MGYDLFVKNVVTGAIRLIYVTAAGVQANVERRLQKFGDELGFPRLWRLRLSIREEPVDRLAESDHNQRLRGPQRCRRPRKPRRPQLFATAISANGCYVAAAANVGSAATQTVIFIPDGLGGAETRATYFAQYGGDGPSGQGTKAAMIGFLLSQAVHDGSGVYGAATEHYLAAIAHGAAPAFGSELALTYGPNVNLVGMSVTADPTVMT